MRVRSVKKTIILLLIFALLIVSIGTILSRIIEKATHPRDYSEYITKYSKEYNVPEVIIYSVIKVESDFDPKAESRAGAIGLMQLMPSTFEDLTDNFLKENLSNKAIYNPETNIKYGTYYLSFLYEYFDCKSWEIVYAAYNGGPGNVQKWLADPLYSDENGNLTNIPLKETRNYVKKVSATVVEYEKIYYNK
jgi:soluble lytic murein transglycosylase